MPKTLELTNIPDEVYARLVARALTNGRSVNSEAIVCLKAVLLTAKIELGQRMTRARSLRGTLAETQFMARDVDALKRRGRS